MRSIITFLSIALPVFLFTSCAPRFYDLFYLNNVENFKGKTLHIELPQHDDSALSIFRKYNQSDRADRLEAATNRKRDIITQAFNTYYDYTNIVFHDEIYEPETEEDYYLHYVRETVVDSDGDSKVISYFQILNHEHKVIIPYIKLNFANETFANKSVARLNVKLHADYNKGIQMQTTP